MDSNLTLDFIAEKGMMIMEATVIRIAIDETSSFVAAEFVNLDSTEVTLKYLFKENCSVLTLETMDFVVIIIAED